MFIFGFARSHQPSGAMSMNNKDTIIAAQEAEILRLQGALDGLREHIRINMFIDEEYDNYNRGNNLALRSVLRELDRLTGASND